MDFGILSLIPPLLAIILAFISRRVIVSLIAGIVSGALIVSGGNVFVALKKTVTVVWANTELSNLTSWQAFTGSWNLFILGFVVVLGMIVVLVSRAGGAKAYGDWAAKRVKTKVGVSFATFFLGVIIFFDDYFNALTVGTVMKPVTDKFKMSRAKLAYLIDATAAPVVILAPVSSWVADVISKIKIAGIGQMYPGNPFAIFLQTIFFNTYAWLTLVMVVFVCWGKVEFGPMKKFEDKAAKTGDVFCGDKKTEKREQKLIGKVSEKGHLIDLVLPLGVMMFFIITFMLYTGGYWMFGGDKGFIDAFMNMKSSPALFWGGVVALIFTCVQFLTRKLFLLKEVPKLLWQGFKIMWPALSILILAWSIGMIIKEDLGTGKYLASLISDGFYVWLLPAIFFVLSALTSFSTGTSWGTFAIMIPIAIPMCYDLSPELLIPILGAVLAGAIFGDHASPISDTTILSSTGAGVKHIDHVRTQFPYALLVASVCFVGFLFAGYLAPYGLIISGLANGVVSLALLLISFNVTGIGCTQMCGDFLQNKH